MKLPKVYVIIVTFNGMKWIAKCLSTLLLSDIPVNIILIDNGSADGTVNFILSNFPQINVIQTETNLGFGKANNIGLLKAINDNADYAFLLNQDAYVEPNTISKLINHQKQNPEYGILSPCQKNGNGTALDRNFENFVIVENNLISHTEENSYEVKFVMAALWLISAECLKKTGLFDPIFQHYGEDNDYLNRARYHGFKTGVLIDAIGYHDREQRADTEKQKIHIAYSAFLAAALDINQSLSKAILVISNKHLKSSIKNIFKLQFGNLAQRQKKFFSLVSKLSDIRRSRSLNKRTFHD